MPKIKNESPKQKFLYNDRDTFWNYLQSIIAKGCPGACSEFKWVIGYIHCLLCGGIVSHCRYVGDHITTQKHQKKRSSLSAYDIVAKQTTIQANQVLTVSSIEEKIYRMEALKAVYKAYLSLSSLDDIRPWLEQYSIPGVTLGTARELVRNYAKPVRMAMFDEIRSVLMNCYSQFSISLDGIPSFAEAECKVLRILSKELPIIELVVRIALFKNKRSADELANHVVKTIM